MTRTTESTAPQIQAIPVSAHVEAPGTISDERDLKPNRVIAAISRAMQMDPAEISLESTFEDLKVEPLDLLNVVFELEDEFKIAIPEQFELSELRDVGDALAAVEALLSREGRESG